MLSLGNSVRPTSLGFETGLTKKAASGQRVYSTILFEIPAPGHVLGHRQVAFSG